MTTETKSAKKFDTISRRLRSNILQQKQNWPISDRCFMLNLRESEVPPLELPPLEQALKLPFKMALD
jgi:hypothetical protein